MKKEQINSEVNMKKKIICELDRGTLNKGVRMKKYKVYGYEGADFSNKIVNLATVDAPSAEKAKMLVSNKYHREVTHAKEVK